MRVVVVTHDGSGQLLTVCADRNTFEDWIDSSQWDRHDVDTWNAKVWGAEE